MEVWVVVDTFRSGEAWQVPRVALERGTGWKVREELMQEAWSVFEFEEGCPFMEKWGRGQVSMDGSGYHEWEPDEGDLGGKRSTSLWSYLLHYQGRVLRVTLAFYQDTVGRQLGTQSRKDIFPQI